MGASEVGASAMGASMLRTKEAGLKIASVNPATSNFPGDTEIVITQDPNPC